MVVAWVLFPLVMLAVCLGCGLLVERVAGWTLPGTVLPSVGLGLVIVSATLTTSGGTAAPTTTWVVLALAIAGYAVSWPHVRALRPEPLAVAVGVAVFLVCAAPVVLSGNAGVAGYFVDNDSAYHMALIDWLTAHGPSLASLHPTSAYWQILNEYISSAYPVGADLGLGALRPLVGQDVAWLFSPYLATILALGGVAIYELLRYAVRSPWLRAACAFVAAQPALAYAFYLESSIKELATTWVITVVVVLVFATLRRRVPLRGALPLLVMAVAGLDVLDLAVVPWLGIPIAVYVLYSLWRSRHAIRRMPPVRIAVSAAGSAVVIAALGAPILGRASTFFETATYVLRKGGAGGASLGTQLGNLPGPLSNWQYIGIWPVGDFRNPLTTHYRVGYALLGVAIASAVLGIVWMIRKRALAPLLMVASSAIATLYLVRGATPYATSKVMMIASMAVLLAAVLGSASLHAAGRRLEGWLLIGLIGFGVLWSNVLQYQTAAVAPRGRLSELAAIGHRYSGQGRALYNQSDEFAVHFVRQIAPDDPATGPVVPAPGVTRTPAQVRLPWDPDQVATSYLDAFRLLVLGRSPRISRPPSNFALAYRGRYYDVWRQTATPQVLEHIPLSGSLQPVRVPSCTLITSTAARARREHARLAYVPRSPAPAIVPTQVEHPPDWGAVQDDPFELIPRGQMAWVVGSLDVPQSGTYQVWLDAAVMRRFDVWVGGEHIGSVQNQLGPPGQFIQVGQVTLAPGLQPVKIVPATGSLRPGQDATDQMIGPLMLAQGTDPPPVAVIDPSRARSLCGHSLDWLEIVR